jgi:hypothetical protein
MSSMLYMPSVPGTICLLAEGRRKSTLTVKLRDQGRIDHDTGRGNSGVRAYYLPGGGVDPGACGGNSICNVAESGVCGGISGAFP